MTGSVIIDVQLRIYGQPLTQSSMLDPFTATTAFKSLLGRSTSTNDVRMYIQL